MSVIFIILGVVFAAYLAILLTMALRQRSMMYLPERCAVDPQRMGLSSCEVFSLQSSDGITLTGWHIRPREGFPTLLYYHGNAGHLGYRAEKLRVFSENGFGILAVHYRGYGDSEGSPTERGIIADAKALYRYATETLRIDPAHIILYGESLGSGVAVRVASEHVIGGLVLEAPYTSVADRAAEIYRYLPARHVLRDKFHSLSRLALVKAPILILHGERDAVIPVAHGKRMLAAANEPKQAVFYPETGHTDFDFARVAHELLAFAGRHGLAALHPKVEK